MSVGGTQRVRAPRSPMVGLKRVVGFGLLVQHQRVAPTNCTARRRSHRACAPAQAKP